MISIVLQISLEDGARREVRSALWQRPVRELVEFHLDLDTKVRITVRPDATQSFGAFEDCAVEPCSLECPRGGKSGNSRPDYSNAIYALQFHVPVSHPLARCPLRSKFDGKIGRLSTLTLVCGSAPSRY